MPVSRRDLLSFLAAGTAVAVTSGCAATPPRTSMYGLIGRMDAAPGRRDALAAILLQGVSDMPGCLSYVVARDPTNADSLWITEAWESQDAHRASLSLPSVQAAIREARPLIAGFGDRHETVPIGGHGLVPARSRA